MSRHSYEAISPELFPLFRRHRAPLCTGVHTELARQQKKGGLFCLDIPRAKGEVRDKAMRARDGGFQPLR